MTIADFLNSMRISLKFERIERNPNMASDLQMDHWRCTLYTNGTRMIVMYSKDKSYGGQEPTLDEVLDCLASDACALERARSFEDWCADYDFDPGSRKAAKARMAIQSQAGSLRRLLGETAYDTLLWNTERMS
jgi:hypothetical protein